MRGPSRAAKRLSTLARAGCESLPSSRSKRSSASSRGRCTRSSIDVHCDTITSLPTSSGGSSAPTAGTAGGGRGVASVSRTSAMSASSLADAFQCESRSTAKREPGTVTRLPRSTSSRQTGHGARPAGPRQPRRHSRQKVCEQRVSTGSSNWSRQMTHSLGASLAGPPPALSSSRIVRSRNWAEAAADGCESPPCSLCHCRSKRAPSREMSASAPERASTRYGWSHACRSCSSMCSTVA
mmetsp:Transcript_24065/g.80006  ORF Transcript_24065/g.80006 Transcript_24065/m.80006 type:complete len:239 (+) Transcript_24065:1724-2440(+)